MPENRRQEYLRAMGIQSYFPRVALPGAPVSKLCEWPAAGEAEAGEGVPVRPVPDPVRTQPAAGKRLQRAERPEPVSVAADDEGIPVSRESVPGRDEIRFQLACIRVNDRLAVINVMPHLGPQQLPGVQRNLLENMLQAAGISHSAVAVEDKPFRWPFLEGEHVEKGAAAAASALTAYLQQKLADWQFQQLLVMGGQVIGRIYASASADNEAEAGRMAPALDGQPWQTVYTRSLDEMLNRPQLKKDVWDDIRALRA